MLEICWKHCCVNNKTGERERSGHRERHEEDARRRSSSSSNQVAGFTGSGDTEGHALSKERLLNAVLHDLVVSHATSWQLALCSNFNSVAKVREVIGQSVAHLYWSATCCATRNWPWKDRALLLSTGSCMTLRPKWCFLIMVCCVKM